MAGMAGELADEVKVGGSANPAVARQIQAPIYEGERVAGRPAGSVDLCLGAVTVIDHDRQRARSLARREVALYAGEINVVRTMHLYPRSLLPPPLTDADRRALTRYAEEEERRSEEDVHVRFGDPSGVNRPGR